MPGSRCLEPPLRHLGYTAPVNNLRFNESPVNLLKNVETMSAAVSTGDMVVPGIRARDFYFTSKSDAV